MNCKDYKEAIAADPSMLSAGATHAATCGSCAAFGEEIRALDLKIGKALDIPVPALKMPELPLIGVEDSNVVNLPFRRARHAGVPVWIGLAASVLLATVLGVRFLGDDVTYPSLAGEIVAHLDHEPNALRVTSQPVSAQRLAAVVRDDVVEMDEELGLITYANTCVINGRKIPHLVIQGKHGPITLLLLPEETIKNAVPLEGDGISGVILPVGQGSIAIIGDRDEAMAEVEQRVIDSVKWTT